jgi:isopropylmalate/homocitrate/citramalate synthase
MPKVWNEPGKWFVNPMNFSSEVTRDFDAPDSIFILDSTVRKITSHPGAYWDEGTILEVCHAADDLGVQIVEVNISQGNMPTTPKILRMFEAIARAGFKFQLFGTAFRNKDSINLAIDRGAQGINMSNRTGRDSPDSTEREYAPIDDVAEHLEYIKSKGLKIAQNVYGPIQNQPPHSPRKRLNALAHLGYAYTAIHENSSTSLPETWRYWIKTFRAGLTDEARSVPIVPHIHNTFGHASMAACAAVTGGAGGVDATANGIADTFGLAALEEVVMTLELLYGIETGLNLNKLYDYSRVVERVTGIPVHPNKPIVGEKAFITASEPALQQVLLARETGRERMNPFPPSLVGNKQVVVWTENSIFGPATKTKLRQMGLPHDRESVAVMLDKLTQALQAKRSYPVYVTEKEFEEMARGLFT